MKTNLRRKPVVVGVILVAAALILSRGGARIGRRVSLFSRPVASQVSADGSTQSPFEVSTQIDTALIGYRERLSIPLTMTTPRAIAVDSRNRIYAGGKGISGLDTTGGVTVSIDTDESVHCLTVDEEDRLYAGFRDAVVRFGTDGRPERTWKIDRGPNSFLTSIAVGGTRIYAADAGMRRLWCLDTSGSATEKVESRGISGFIVPSACMDVAIGQDNSIWVVNPGRHLVQNFRPNGDLLSSWGESGTHLEGFCGCCGPTHMTIMPNGNFVTSEKGIARVKVYSPAGKFLTVVASPEQFHPRETGLDLAVNSRGDILVLDTHEKRIRIFEKKPG